MKKRTTRYANRYAKRTSRKARRMASSTWYITIVAAIGVLVVLAAK